MASTANFGGLVGAGADHGAGSGSAWAAEPALGAEAAAGAGGRMRRQAGAGGEEADGLVRIKSETDMSGEAWSAAMHVCQAAVVLDVWPDGAA